MRLTKLIRLDSKGQVWWDAVVEQRAPDGRLAAAVTRFAPGVCRRTIAHRIAADRWSVRLLIASEGQRP